MLESVADLTAEVDFEIGPDVTSKVAADHACYDSCVAVLIMLAMTDMIALLILCVS